jgi:Calcineurin-like phosphoesterase
MISEDIIFEYEYSNRIVIIGDIHGDIRRFKDILIDAKIINNNIEWTAEPVNTIVVQMGDQVDSVNRDPSLEEWEVLPDVEMIYFTDLLNKIALSKGGRVISLIGNHELMNIIGNFSYVSQNSLNNNYKRQELFKPGGTLSAILSQRPLVVKIGKLLFCHAGLTLEHLKILSKYNKDISYINTIWKNFIKNNAILIEDKEIFENIILDMNGMLWTRDLNNAEDLIKLKEQLGCIYMFVGHTVVERVKLINDFIWYTDTGISRSFGNTSYQYIDIFNNQINIKNVLPS